MKIAWLGLLAFGFAGVLATSACEVTTGGAGGIDDEGGRSSGGTGASTGGSASGGTSTGGASGGSTTGGSETGGSTTGGSETGGSATGGSATGGSATGGDTFNPMCDNADNPGFPATSCDVPEVGTDENIACLKCLKENDSCCDALKKCYATGPDNQCGYGGMDLGQTEYLCFQDCILDKIMENGTYTNDDQDMCAFDCSPECGIPADATNDVITCMHDNCEDECFPQ